ncbi:MAG: diguanylate cyclase [Gallionella sp.]|nr:diguanylate cyclase [Gallionella sp.]
MRQYSIRQHVALLTLAPLLIMAISLESYFLHDRFSDFDNDLMEHGQLIARQLASSSEYGVFANNRLYLQNIAQGALQQPDVRGVAILNAASESMYEEGKFSSASAMSSKSPAADANMTMPGRSGKIRLAQDGKAKEFVNLQTPIRISSESLWVYQPIIPAQVALDETGANSGVKPAVQQVGAVILELSRVRTGQLKSRMFWLTIGATLLFLALPCCLIYFTSRSITYPIRKLSDAIQEIGDGKLETRISVSGHVTELSTLARGINDMAAQLQHETAVLRQRVEEATRIAAIAFESHEGMMVTDANGVIIRVNNAFTKITGYTSEEAVGQTPKLLSSGFQNADFYALMWDSINCIGAWHGEIWNRRKSGEIYPVWAAITAVEKEDGEVAYCVATYTDITLRKAAENEINNLAYYDALTQLPNRRMFVDRLAKTMAASKRSGRYGALMFLDLDNFKPLNDKHGHAAGDLLLVEAARRLVSCVREVDTVARFGGDEFVVMLSELDTGKAESTAQAGIIAEKIRAVLAESYTLTNQQNGYAMCAVEHRCTSSIGVVLFIGHEASEDDLINCADRAMYHAKEGGRNAIRFYQ